MSIAHDTSTIAASWRPFVVSPQGKFGGSSGREVRTDQLENGNNVALLERGHEILTRLEI